MGIGPTPFHLLPFKSYFLFSFNLSIFMVIKIKKRNNFKYIYIYLIYANFLIWISNIQDSLCVIVYVNICLSSSPITICEF